MKALVSYRHEPMLFHQPGSLLNVFRCLPDTDVIECTDYTTLKNNLRDVDFIFFLQLAMMPLKDSQKEEIVKLNDIKGLFLSYTSLDPWYAPQFDRRRRCDVMFHTVLRPFLRKRSEYQFHWIPMACGVHQSGIEKDFDVLIWGKANEKYPFRAFANETLFGLVVREGEQFTDGFYTKIIKVGNKEYTMAFLGNKDGNYYGEPLYDVISRAKIVVTGPHGAKMAVGKYVENASCGAVSVTCDFEDRLSLGYEHGQHLWITDETNLLKDLGFLLEHPDLVAEMGHKAQELVRYRHTPEVRAWQLRDYLFIRTGKG